MTGRSAVLFLCASCAGFAAATCTPFGSADSGAITDGGVTSDGGASDAPDLSVGRIPNLVLWLDGDRGVARDAGAFRWADQSGHGNDATAPATVPLSSNVGFNGHSAVAFNGTQYLSVPDGLTVRFTKDYAVLVVARSQMPPEQYGALFEKSTVANPYAGPGMYVNYPLSGSTTTSVGAQVDVTHFVLSTDVGVSDGVARIFEMQRQGTMLSVRVNGNPAASTTVPSTDVTAPGVDIFVGGNPVGSVFEGLVGAIAEVVAINGTLNAGDDALLHSYLMDKYALH